MKVRNQYRKDSLLIGILLAVVIFFILLQYFYTNEPGEEIRITQGGKVTGVYSLQEDRTISLQNEYGSNILVIQGGTAYMQEADCPDQICVRQREICMQSEHIICLPNQLVITVENGEEGEVDSIAY